MTPCIPFESIYAEVHSIEPHGKNSSGGEASAEHVGKQASRPCGGKGGGINGRLGPPPTVWFGCRSLGFRTAGVIVSISPFKTEGPKD